MIPLSILDLAPVFEGSTAADSLRNSLDLARHAEKWGYNRFWLAEHHNMVGIASAATSVVIGHIAGGTKTIRVGAGGIMLPNHSPLVIAEQFGTLEALYPGRIDLRLGRAPGTDQRAFRALRRSPAEAENFPQDVAELQIYLGDTYEGQIIQAVPGGGSHIPLWILGSSLFGAQFAAAMGLPYAFASHFAPDALMQAIQVYRSQFQPSDQLSEPYIMLAANVFAAETDEEAQYHFTTIQQQFAKLRRGNPGKLPKPVHHIEEVLSPAEMAGVSHALSCSFVGSKATVKEQLTQFVERTEPDEIMATGAIYDHTARLRSFEILAEIKNEIGI